ncbi:cyanoexosortase A system-associated protein [cf. Phormidesmis sp. LEGE 11477]|uniref:cyanoexosortase A system-associated protein n=1 Tax=cf. Phormidesmis sp. LEGE 11477 TaxID=1828680 RepID=UPI00188280C6|nr:cyanoexosortase A system-associated protein [cf. Phormidesmis sp. LEGE 11477]MBE9062335.1 cyanoexosortase A system-associated protein [cf. Phormidesmis sp. LEGE 11477]
MKPEGLWTSIWRFLLLFSFGGVYIALAAVVLRPSSTQAKSEPFLFPDQISISSWQFVDADVIEGPNVRRQGRRYRYAQNERTLVATLWYGRDGRACQNLLREQLSASGLPASSEQASEEQVSADQISGDRIGNVSADEAQVGGGRVGGGRVGSAQVGDASVQAASAISVHTSIEGSYRYISQLGVDSLQALIDARGGSVVTHEQFMRNRYRYFLRPRSMLRWLTGKESIVGDHDCLLTELSIETTSALSRPLLDSAWQDVSQWGQAQLYAKP